MAPRSEWKPSRGITASISRVSSSLVLLLKMVTRSTFPFPCRALTSQKVRSSQSAHPLQLLHLIDGGLVGPESVAAVNQHDRLGHTLKIDRPVKG